MKIFRLLTTTFFIFQILSCTSTSTQKVPLVKPDPTKEIFYKVLDNPPSPSEVRVIGKRIDSFFSEIVQADSQYVAEVTKIVWGDVYDPIALNNSKKLKTLLDLNQKGRELLLEAFRKRKLAYGSALKDLNELAEKSLFAKAMLEEIKNRYNEPETGFATIEAEMLKEALDKLETIDQKIKLFIEAEGSYKVMPDMQVAFSKKNPRAEELGKTYLDIITRHNQCTARQRTLASFFIQQQQYTVSRFHELKGKTNE